MCGRIYAAAKGSKCIAVRAVTSTFGRNSTIARIEYYGWRADAFKKSVENYVLPLLKYAHQNGIRTQINSNLTLDPDRYLLIAPYLDVLHISHNWGTVDDFIDGGFANMARKPTREQRKSYLTE